MIDDSTPTDRPRDGNDSDQTDDQNEPATPRGLSDIASQLDEIEAPDEVKQELERVVVERSMEWSAPYPSPFMLGEFEKVLPGAADRILSMAERQSAHRQEMERKSIEGGLYLAKWGLYAGWSLAALLVVGAIILFAIGRPIEGLISIGIPTITISGSWIWERLSKPGELQQKRDEIDDRGADSSQQ